MIPNCAQVGANGFCLKCAFRFWSNNGVCQQVSDQCKSWSLTNGQCTDCYDGYGLSYGVCVVRPQVQPLPTPTPTIPNCAQVGPNGYCIRCAFRFWSNNGICQQVSDQCKSWSLTNGQCTDCYDGYGLNNGACVVRPQVQPVPTPTPTVPNCAQVAANGACLKCAYRYWSSNGVCVKVDDQCKSWNDYNGQCTSCYDGYELYNGACYVKKQVLPVQPQPSQTVTIPGCA